MLKIALYIQKFLTRVSIFLAAAFKILFLSKWKTQLPPTSKSKLLVLGNGPTLENDLEKVDVNEMELMAVNYFVNDALFAQFRPSHYLLCDPHFFSFSRKDELHQFYKSLYTAAKWPLNLFIPFSFRKNFKQLLKEFGLTNELINVIYYNTSNSNGKGKLTHLAYNRGLLTPSPTTVLIPCLMQGIRMGFKEVGITGASHNYHENLNVGLDNRLRIRVPHFYEEEEEYKLAKKPESEETYTLSEFFLILHKMFGSYEFVSIFARRKGCKLLNYTKNSFIDQLERR